MRLFGAVAMPGAYGAGAAGAATFLHTICTTRGLDVRDAGGDVIAFHRESIDRTGGQTRLVRATVTRPWPSIGRRQFERLAKRQRAAPGMPQAPIGMDQHAERRWMYRFRFLRPAEEGQPRRTLKRKQRRRAELMCEVANDAQRPAVQRIGRAVVCFRRVPEMPPVSIAGEADENQRAGIAAIRPVVRRRMKCAAIRQSPRFYCNADTREGDWL